MTEEAIKIIENTIKQLRELNACEGAKTQPNMLGIQANKNIIKTLSLELLTDEFEKRF